MKRSRPNNTSELVNLLQSSQQVRLLSLETSEVSPRPQRRVDFGDIESLAESIKTRGQDNPISVRKSLPSDNVSTPYVIISGERRWRACKLLSIPVQAIDKKLLTNEHDTILEAVENFQRKDLTPFETASIIDKLLTEGLKKKDIAKIMGRNSQFISTHFKLLDARPEVISLFENEYTSDPESLATLQEIFDIDPGLGNEIVEKAASEGVSRHRLRTNLRSLKNQNQVDLNGSGGSEGEEAGQQDRGQFLLKDSTAGASTNQSPRGSAVEQETHDSDLQGNSHNEKIPHAEEKSTMSAPGENGKKKSSTVPSNNKVKPTGQPEGDVKVMVLVMADPNDAFMGELMLVSTPENKVRVRTSDGEIHLVDAQNVSIQRVG